MQAAADDGRTQIVLALHPLRGNNFSTMPINRATGEPPELRELGVDSAVLRSIWERRRRPLLLFALIFLVASAAVGLTLFPQTYTSVLSISLQQPSQGSSLASLAGLGASSRKYTGALKSWKFAEEVENAAHTQQLYGFASRQEAVEELMKRVYFDDNQTDGLLYITVSLKAPPLLAADPDGRRARIRQAAQTVVTEYARSLRRYLMLTDTDKDAVLLRAADHQLKQARDRYESSVKNWMALVRNVKASPESLAGAASGSVAGGPEVNQLQSLYIKRGQLEAQIKSSEAALNATNSLVGQSPSLLAQLPAEDNLLALARRDYLEAQASLQALQVQYNDAYPAVQRARARLNSAEKRLHAQSQAILRGNTSERVKRAALQVEYETVLHQVTRAEQHVQVSRELATDFEKYHAEVGLNLKVLETTASRYAELKIQTVAAQNRMSVVDEAHLLPRSRPGFGMIGITCVFLTLAISGALIALEYLIRSLRSQEAAPAAGASR